MPRVVSVGLPFWGRAGIGGRCACSWVRFQGWGRPGEISVSVGEAALQEKKIAAEGAVTRRKDILSLKKGEVNALVYPD